MSGILYVRGTPIGNLKDVSLRCLEILDEVDIIAAEDTRNSIKLLNRYEIKTKLTSYHEHNKVSKGNFLISELKSGKNIALVTDCGMPGISDPGEDLIRGCYENGISVTSVPGPTAVITALVLSGLSTRRYCFEGFLPHNKKERLAILNELKLETRTICFYEAPHKLIQTLRDVYEALGDRKCSVVKEITKKYEWVKTDLISNQISYFEENEARGEYVVVVEGISMKQVALDEKDEFKTMDIEQHVKLYENQGFDNKTSIKLVAKDRGVSKREIYSYMIDKK